MVVAGAAARAAASVAVAEATSQVELLDAGSIPGVAAPLERLRRTELDSGVVVLTDTVEHSRTAAIGVYVATGSRDEADDHQGVSHMLEHLLFKGTADASASAIARAMDQVGGELNAFTTSEHTVFHVRVPATAADLALGILMEVVSRAALRPEDLDVERQVVLEELGLALDDPEDLVVVRLFEAAFPGHPLGREVLGSVESIEAIDRDVVAGFRDRWYRPANVVVTAAGRVDHDAVARRVEAAWTGFDPGARPDRPVPGPATSVTVEERRPGDVTQFAQAWRTCSLRDDDRTTLGVVSHLLGGGPSSRLFQQIREDRALTYSIGTAVNLYTDAGVLSLQSSTGSSRQDDLLGAVDEVVEEFLADGPTEEEVDRACRSMWAGAVLALEDVGARAGRLAGAELAHGSVAPITDFRDRLDEVTVDSVVRVAGEVLGSEVVTSLVLPD